MKNEVLSKNQQLDIFDFFCITCWVYLGRVWCIVSLLLIKDCWKYGVIDVWEGWYDIVELVKVLVV